MSGNRDFRTYQRADCAVFRKTAEAFGGLSNMAPGFPVRINGTRILTVEALYQACRFPHRPEVQRKIIEQTSPMTAKMVGKPFRQDSRPDWDRVRVKIMRWVLRLKLAMHWTKFSELLLSTGDRPIVEDSRKDDFWGAMPTDGTTLVGMNVLGRLLMELREEIKQGKELRRVEPPSIPEFWLFDEAMGVVDFPVTEQGKREREVPFLKVSDMNLPGNNVWIESSNNTVSREDAQKLGAFVFPAGSIIFPKVGGAMLTNKRRLLKHPSCVDNNVMGCIVRRGHPEFLFLLLQQLDFGRLSKPGPVPAIGEGEIREIKVVFPPLDEQRAIVPAVEKETELLNAVIARTEREIALMQEYRTRLTADIVTGKLDVREAAAKLPDLSPDTTPEPIADEALEEIETEGN